MDYGKYLIGPQQHTHAKLWKQSFTIIKFMSTDDAGAGTASPLSV
jgi:hypothetical protein